MSDLATIAQLNLQIEHMKQEKIATKAREQLRAAKEKASRAEKKYAEASKQIEVSERKILQQQYRIDSLAETLATNSTALLEVVFKMEEAEEKAEKTENALREQIAELVEQHRETVAEFTTRNIILQDELNNEKEASLHLVSSDDNKRVKDAEEAARRAKGKANHLVRSQAGQLNRLKAMCDGYRARYGKLDDANAFAATISSANALSSSGPIVNQNGDHHSSINGAAEGTSQSFADLDSVSNQPATTWDTNSRDLDPAPGASSIADGRLDDCPNPGSDSDARSSSNQRGTGYKTRHRRGTRPRSLQNPSQLVEELPADTPTGPKAHREVNSETGAGSRVG